MWAKIPYVSSCEILEQGKLLLCLQESSSQKVPINNIVLQVQEGQIIELTFDHLDIEGHSQCNYDALMNQYLIALSILEGDDIKFDAKQDIQPQISYNLPLNQTDGLFLSHPMYNIHF